MNTILKILLIVIKVEYEYFFKIHLVSFWLPTSVYYNSYENCVRNGYELLM